MNSRLPGHHSLMSLHLHDAPDQLDRMLGDGLEQAVSAHHRRRLRRVGWEHALDVGPSFEAGAAVAARDGHEVEVFVDGADALPAMVRELRGARKACCLPGGSSRRRSPSSVAREA